MRLSQTEKRARVYLEGLVCLIHARAWVRSARTAKCKREEQARDNHAINDESLRDHTGRQDQENAGKSMTLAHGGSCSSLEPCHVLQTVCSKNLAAEIPFLVNKMRVTQLPQGLPESVS